MIRREFIKAAGASAIGAMALLHLPEEQVAHAAGENLSYQGTDLSNWLVAVGDGVFAAEGEAPVGQDDIATLHFGDHSELRANVHQRGIMAHNITYNQQTVPDALDYVHLCEFSFRLPYVPSTSNWEQNAQTFEASFFIWDGSNTRLDYGIALQWILNPWMNSFGKIRTWVNVGDPAQPRNVWKSIGQLNVDTNWHTIKLVFDYQFQTTAMAIDGNHCLSSFSTTPKAGTWSGETVARFGAEIISIFPGSNPNAPSHTMEVRDWRWLWIQ